MITDMLLDDDYFTIYYFFPTYKVSKNKTNELFQFQYFYPKLFLQVSQYTRIYLSGYRHTTISLICMSAYKASAARCHLDHQATSGQPAIRALPWPLWEGSP